MNWKRTIDGKLWYEHLDPHQFSLQTLECVKVIQLGQVAMSHYGARDHSLVSINLESSKLLEREVLAWPEFGIEELGARKYLPQVS